MFELTADLMAEIANPDEMSRIMSWLDDLAMIDAAHPQSPVVKLVAARRQCSLRTVYGKYYGVQQHGPMFLKDGRAARKATSLPAPHRNENFIQWVHSLYYSCARNNATPTVQEQMLARLRAWRSDPTNPDLRIPGYLTPPLDSAESRYRYPFGWSQRQLNEIKPTTYQAAEGRIGRHKSRELLPPVLTTRIGLHPGEVYLFDDQYYDLMVHWGDKPVRPVGLNALCLASGCDVIRGIRPELSDNPEGEKSLTRRDTVWLTIDLLSNEGYYRDRCRLVFESGTSSLDQEFIDHLSLATDRRVTVDIGEVSKDVVRGVLLPSKGNPRFKAARESWFNLLRNRMGALPLALGMDRHHKPEDSDRLTAEDHYLLSVATELGPDALASIMTEGLPWSRFFPIAQRISESINLRTDHNLEGWGTEGRERVMFRLGSEWIDEREYLRLAPDTRALIVHRMREGEVVSRVEKLSPREVFESGRSNLLKISPFRWHLLIPKKYAIARTVPANRQLTIDRRDYGPEAIHFHPFYHTETREQKPLPAGADILVFLSPLRPHFCVITRTDGTLLGVVFAIEKGTRLEIDPLLAQWGVRNQLQAAIGGTATTYNKEIAEHRQQRRETNAEALRLAGATDKQIRKITHPTKPQQNTADRAKKPRRKSLPKSTKPALPEPDGLGIF